MAQSYINILYRNCQLDAVLKFKPFTKGGKVSKSIMLCTHELISDNILVISFTSDKKAWLLFQLMPNTFNCKYFYSAIMTAGFYEKFLVQGFVSESGGMGEKAGGRGEEHYWMAMRRGNGELGPKGRQSRRLCVCGGGGVEGGCMWHIPSD